MSLPSSIALSAQLFLLDHVENGVRGREADRRAGVGAAEAAGQRGVHQLGAAGDGGEREAAAKALGHADQVRHHAGMLDREHFAGAGEAGLDFVGDEQDAVLFAQLLQFAQEFVGGDIEPALALHRLDDDRRRPAPDRRPTVNSVIEARHRILRRRSRR